MNELSISDSGLSTLLHSGAGLPATMTRDIFLVRQSVVGTRYQGGAEDLMEDLKPGERVTLLHEADNQYDGKAVVVIDRKGRKLGYIPRYQNAVIAALLDAGKVFYGLVTETPKRYDQNDDTSAYKLYIDLYMREFLNPEEMNAVPRHGYEGSFAVVAVEISENEEDEGGSFICGLYAIKVINGEERGHFQRSISAETDRNTRRKILQEFDDFTGYLPLVGHGLEGEKLKALEEAYGVLLGEAFSNHVIDTEQMGRIHLPWIKDSSLDSYAKELGIEREAASEPERECRLVWEFYRRLERSELER